MAVLLERVNGEGLTRSASVPSYSAAYTAFLRFRLTTLPVDGRSTLWNLKPDGVGEPEQDIVYLDNLNGNVLVLRVIDHSGGFNQILAFGTTVLIAGVDYDVFIERTSDTHLDLYLNGVLEASGTAAAAPTQVASKFAFGQQINGVDPMNGAISDMAIWTAALSAPDRATIRASGARQIATNLWERWSGLNHLLITGDVNGRGLTAVGSLSTVANPAIPGIPPQSITDPVQLAITTQPTGGKSGSPLAQQPTIHVLNINGGIVDDVVTSVTASILTGTGVLVGSVIRNSVAGIVVFPDLQINGFGAHSIRFTAAGLISADSNVFVVAPSQPASTSLLPVARNARGDALAGKVVTFVSSNPAVATVNSSGFVRAIAPGVTNITATSEGVDSQVAIVTVTAPS